MSRRVAADTDGTQPAAPQTTAPEASSPAGLTPQPQLPLSASEAEAREVFYFQRLSDVVEQEMLDRLSLVQRHHVAYTRIADHFITLLQQACDENEVRMAHLFPADATELYAGSPAPGALVLSSPRSPRSVRLDGSASPGRGVERHTSRSQRTAHVDPDVVELVSVKCARRQRATERKLRHDIHEQRQLSSYHLAQEHQRAVASLRRQAQFQAEKEAKRNKTRHHRGKESVMIEREAEEAKLRAAANVRMAAIDAKNERLKQQRAAAVAAVRSIDMYTRQHVAQRRQEATHQSQDEERALRAALSFEMTDKLHSERVLRTYQHEADFVDRLARKEYKEHMDTLRKVSKKQEHSETTHLRSVVSSMSTPREYMTPVEAARQRALAAHTSSHITKTRARGVKPINDDKYTRLCGAHAVLSKGECPTREQAELVRKLSPNHLACIQHIGPSTMWATIGAIQADAVPVRGPMNVGWR